MEPEDASRVFERFWRSDPSRARASGGAGLGLAIVAAIAEAHGGRAEVQTSPGQGATFRVRIPLNAPVVPEQHTPNGSDAAPPNPTPATPPTPEAPSDAAPAEPGATA